MDALQDGQYWNVKDDSQNGWHISSQNTPEALLSFAENESGDEEVLLQPTNFNISNSFYDELFPTKVVTKKVLSSQNVLVILYGILRCDTEATYKSQHSNQLIAFVSLLVRWFGKNAELCCHTC